MGWRKPVRFDVIRQLLKVAVVDLREEETGWVKADTAWFHGQPLGHIPVPNRFLACLQYAGSISMPNTLRSQLLARDQSGTHPDKWIEHDRISSYTSQPNATVGEFDRKNGWMVSLCSRDVVLSHYGMNHTSPAQRRFPTALLRVKFDLYSYGTPTASRSKETLPLLVK